MRKFTSELSLDAYTLALAHFHNNNRWAHIGRNMGLISTTASVLSGASLLTDIQGFELYAGLLAILASITIAIATFLNPNRQSSEHHSAATNYIKIYHDTQFFYHVESQKVGADTEELMRKLTELKDEYNEQDQRSPRVGVSTYDRGRREARKHFASRGHVIEREPT